MDQVEDWLRQAGLADYIELFAEQKIDADVIGELSDDDLRELDMPLGARKRFMRALPFQARSHIRVPHQTAEAERRQVTVMFCDLVDSTPLAERVDPEELKTLIESYQDICRAVVANYEGFIARYSGDGILVYFGYPQAHEGDGQRAVYAAIDIVEAIAKREELKLQVHIGIHTGLVVAGDTHEKAAVTGETPNIAARLEGLAGPNEILMSAATKALVDAFVLSESAGPQTLKGVSRPVEAFQVKRRIEQQDDTDSRSSSDLPPIVGRDGEIQLIAQKWSRALENEPQAVVVVGEPGVGKTRLVRSLSEDLLGEHTRLNYFCSAFHQNTAFFPITTQLNRAVGWGAQDDDEAKQAQLLNFAGSLVAQPDVVADVLGQLFGLSKAPASSAQHFKDAVSDALFKIIRSISRRRPLLMVVEDVHWADPSTIDVLRDLTNELVDARVMIVVTSRSEGQDRWTALLRATSLSLTPLGRQDSIRLVENLIRSMEQADELAAVRIVDQADGVPLFLEELTKSSVQARGPRSSARQVLNVPTSLQDALMARLDSLGELKEVAQVSSIFGRRLDVAGVSDVTGRARDDIELALTQLVDSDLLVRRLAEDGEEPTYEFRHALIRDLAYDSLLKSKRLEYHGRIARRLASSDEALAPAEVLAWHFEQSGQIAQAVEQLTIAARVSIGLFAHSEAAQHLQHAIELCHGGTASAARDEQELRLRLMLGPSLMILGGYASAAVEVNYSSARGLYENHPDPSELFSVLHGLYEFQMVGGNLPGAHMLAEEILQIGKERSDPLQTLLGQRALGTICILQGDIEACLELTNTGIELVPQVPDENVFAGFGHDPRVALRLYNGWALALRGQLPAAEQMVLSALQIAERIEQPMSIGFALCYTGLVLNVAGFFDQARPYIDRARSVCGEHQMPLWDALSKVQLGWSELELGDFAEGLALNQQGTMGWHATGARSGTTLFFTFAAEYLAKRGQLTEASEYLDEAERFRDDTGELVGLADIFLIRADIEGSTGPKTELLTQALDIACQQNAVLSQLRVLTRLAELEATDESRTPLEDLLESFSGAEASMHVRRARAALR